MPLRACYRAFVKLLDLPRGGAHNLFAAHLRLLFWLTFLGEGWGSCHGKGELKKLPVRETLGYMYEYKRNWQEYSSLVTLIQ